MTYERVSDMLAQGPEYLGGRPVTVEETPVLPCNLYVVRVVRQLYITRPKQTVFKVGWTLQAMHQRFRELQCGCPLELEPCFSMPGTWALEQHFHSVHKNGRNHIRGEWYVDDRRGTDRLAGWVQNWFRTRQNLTWNQWENLIVCY